MIFSNVVHIVLKKSKESYDRKLLMFSSLQREYKSSESEGKVQYWWFSKGIKCEYGGLECCN